MSVVIASACRTAIGSFGGTLAPLTAPGAERPSKEAIARAARSGQIDDVVLIALQAGAGMNVARQAALGAGLRRAFGRNHQPRPAPVCRRDACSRRDCGGSAEIVALAARVDPTRRILKGALGYWMGNAEAVDMMVAEGLTC